MKEYVKVVANTSENIFIQLAKSTQKNVQGARKEKVCNPLSPASTNTMQSDDSSTISTFELSQLSGVMTPTRLVIAHSHQLQEKAAFTAFAPCITPPVSCIIQKRGQVHLIKHVPMNSVSSADF